MRRRLDQELLRRGLVQSRTAGQTAIDAGRVLVDGVVAQTPARLVAPEQAIHVQEPTHAFVSRGGIKLAAALEHFAIHPEGMRCLDVGASTGGFTDCLLQAGAESVVALDVGHGQLDWRIRNDPRVTVIERVNFRSLAPGMFPKPFELVVADVSFISLRLLAPSFQQVLSPSGTLILLVKPQFEVGRASVGPGGIVTNVEARTEAVAQVAECFASLGLPFMEVMESPITGADGNVEFLALSRPQSAGTDTP